MYVMHTPFIVNTYSKVLYSVRIYWRELTNSARRYAGSTVYPIWRTITYRFDTRFWVTEAIVTMKFDFLHKILIETDVFSYGSVIIFKFPLKFLKLQYKFSEIKNKNKIDAAAKNDAGGDDQLLFFFTWP